MSISAGPTDKPLQGTRYSRIEAILRAELSPTLLEIRDESHLHAGHNADAAAGGETHFRIKIASPRFAGLSRVAQHQLVNTALAYEFNYGLHALALTTLVI